MEAQEALVAAAPSPLADPSAGFDALVEQLAKLSRNHLLYFRIEVGRAVADSLYGGDPDAYRSQAGNKEGSLHRFATEQAERLADLGLTEVSLRQSLQAWFVVQELPRDLVRQLVFSHVVELSRVDDGATRRTLAHAIVENGWTGKDLRNAVLAVRAGLPIDADLAAPGLQPSAAPEETEARKPQTGRVVSRFEKHADELAATLADWDVVSSGKITKLQSSRVRDALSRLKAQIAELEAKLGAE